MMTDSVPSPRPPKSPASPSATDAGVHRSPSKGFTPPSQGPGALLARGLQACQHPRCIEGRVSLEANLSLDHSPKPPRIPLSPTTSQVDRRVPSKFQTCPATPEMGSSPPSSTILVKSTNSRRLSAGMTDHVHETLDIGSYTLSGTRYADLNQDYMVVQEIYTCGEIPRGGQQTYVVAICDGHGILGDKSACFAGKALARHVYTSNLRNKHLSKLPGQEVQDTMKAAFARAHHAANMIYDMPPKTVMYPVSTGSSKTTSFGLVDVGGVKVYRSEKGTEKMLECGTTCTAAIMQGRCVCLANVGDSLAVLGKESLQGEVTSEMVTVRHHCKLDSEAKRIKDMHLETTDTLDDGYIRIKHGPWAGYELAVTRALGHKHIESMGVLYEPHCAMLDIDPTKLNCLVLASDGLWDVMTAEEVVAFAMDGRRRGQKATQIARSLVELAVQKSLETLDEADNTSAIVVFFPAEVLPDSLVQPGKE